MTKFFFKFKNPYFLDISPMFGAKKVFPKNRAVMQNMITVSDTMPNSEKSNDPIPRKHVRKDRQTLFYRVLPPTARGITSTIAVD